MHFERDLLEKRPMLVEKTGFAYRYGFQGQENDDEVKGGGNSVNYKYRMHDPRVGRFFAVDPLSWKYPYYSPYQFSSNSPILAIELEGLESSVQINFPEGSIIITRDKNKRFTVTQDQLSQIKGHYDGQVNSGSTRRDISNNGVNYGGVFEVECVKCNPDKTSGYYVSIKIPNEKTIKRDVLEWVDPVPPEFEDNFVPNMVPKDNFDVNSNFNSNDLDLPVAVDDFAQKNLKSLKRIYPNFSKVKTIDLGMGSDFTKIDQLKADLRRAYGKQVEFTTSGNGSSDKTMVMVTITGIGELVQEGMKNEPIQVSEGKPGYYKEGVKETPSVIVTP
jgi:RHS repeat-associated protein